MNSGYLSELVRVRGRFHRSVNIRQDWTNPGALGEYLVTPTIRDLAVQVLQELQDPRGARAWSVTGPYGSGKSAFALFLGDILANRRPVHPEARALSREFGLSRKPFLPVLLVAAREPLQQKVAAGIAEAFRGVDARFSRSVRAKAEKLSADELASVLEEASRRAWERGYGGVMLVVDELGKFLEYASDEASGADVFFLQALAEAASRSPRPVLFITILHSALADYLPSGDEIRRLEWQKVQGRFRDVPFQLPAEQVLALVSAALCTAPMPDVQRQWKALVESALESPALAEARARMPLDRLLYGCVPLHPVTALLLWPLFRSKVAQNERSLFAFLTSAEPFGFQDFLTSSRYDTGSAPVYRAWNLYDYVTRALGMGAFRGDHARKWALVDDALGRLPADASPLCSAIIKTVGLLDMYGVPVGLAATRETLRVVTGAPEEELEATLRWLMQSSILLFRRHNQSYALWEGSDVDLEAAFESARHKLGGSSLAARLRQALDLRPIVARAHYIERGTLRLFEVDLADAPTDTVAPSLEPASPGDGRILFLVGDREGGVDAVVGMARDLTVRVRHPLFMVAVPRNVDALRRTLLDFECWRWIRDNLLELQGDPVARQEVRARLLYARDRFEELAGPIFGLPGHQFEPARSVWVYRGQVCDIRSGVQFQRWLSALCEQVFNLAPRFQNELLNRESLSSAASAARRTLLERMLTHAHVPRLGIEGTPPEASMYQSMLALGGFHRRDRTSWRFAPPSGDWRPAWDAVVEFVESAREERRPVQELFRLLKQPPYGLREGPLPVLLLAALVVRADEIALYEEGVYVPELRIEVIERLIRRPETFEVQSHRIGRKQEQALRALETVLLQAEEGKTQGRSGSGRSRLLPIARSLVQFAARLNPYARQTQRVHPPEAALVRDELLGARDPRSLLFVDLPRALGIDLEQEGAGQRFAKHLRECLLGLGRAYGDLLNHIESLLREAFALRGTSTEARAELQRRAQPLLEFAIDPRLKLFVREAAGGSVGRDWREVLGRAVNGGLPPTHWRDADVDGFAVQLKQVAGEFLRLEELVSEKHRAGAGRVIRIGVLDGTWRETRAVIPPVEGGEALVVQYVQRIREVLESASGNGSRDTWLAALAEVAVGLMEEDKDRGAIQ